MRIGIELEFWVIDEEGRLDLAKPVSERVYFASQEFSKSMIEIQTEPHGDLDSLFEELISKVEILSELAKKDGKKIVPLGTPLNSGEVNVYESDRFKLEQEIVGSEVKHAGRTAGLHIHFEKEDVKDQLNMLTALDPALATMNSSPYYQGKRIASDSRNKVYRYKACGPFPEQRQLWNYVDSKEEWRYKRRKLFEEFEKAAENKGIKKEKLKKHFTPEDAVWTPVKLREDYPTVEWRALDTSLVSEVIKVVRSAKPLMENTDSEKDLPGFDKVRKNSEKAIEKGLKSKDVRKYLEDVGFDYQKFSPISEQIGGDKNISRKRARKIRKDAARKLSKDLVTAKNL